MTDIDKMDVLKDALGNLALGVKISAASRIKSRYPFVPQEKKPRRSFSPKRCMMIFMRDGFINRYTSARLITPAALRSLSLLIPEVFPFQSAWKMTETHMAYWDLFPTLDHVISVSHGGSEEETNLVTTSMMKNMVKANWTLEDLGWKLYPPGNLDEWDGLVKITSDLVNSTSILKEDRYIITWCRAAML